MLNSHNYDLVCIATPTDLHAPITLKALEKDAHILTEKPTAMNSIEAKQMLDTAIKYKKIHMIDHELRFNPNRKKIKDVTFDIDFHLSNLGVVINNILFEDKNILVINKPAGLVVHPGAGNKENTLVNGLLHLYKNNLSLYNILVNLFYMT